MTSTFDSEFLSSVVPELQDEFGDSVTRYVLGVVANTETVADAVFEEMDPESVINDQGKKVIRKAILWVPTGTDCDVKDAWLINSEVWQATAIGSEEGGEIPISLTLAEIETKRNRRY